MTNYFDKWGQHLMAILIDEGIAEIQEFVLRRLPRQVT